MNPTLNVLELRQLGEGSAQIVDVRSSSEFAAGHIPGAVNIPMDQIEGRLPDLRTGAPLILVCQKGKRAEMTARLLEPCRYQISVLEGGTSAWIEAGYPVVRSVKTRWSLERQVRLGAGVLVLTGFGLGLIVNSVWFFLAAFVGLGLTFAGLTDLCLMGIVLERMPWNRQRHCERTGSELELSRQNR